MSHSQRPDITVAIMSYNNARFISHTIESVLAETGVALELIVFDDCSSDDSVAIFERYTSDPRFSFSVNEQNLGMMGNYNRCVDSGSGRYVVVLGSDDLVYPGHLASLFAALELHPESSLAYTQCNWIDENGDLIRHADHPGHPPHSYFGHRDEVVDLLIHDNYITPSAVMLRRSVLDRVRRPDGHVHAPDMTAGDWELWTRIARTAPDFIFLRQATLGYRIHGGQVSQDFYRSDKPLAEHVSILELNLADQAARRRLQKAATPVWEHYERRLASYPPDVQAKYAPRGEAIRHLLFPRSNHAGGTEPLFSIIVTTFNRPLLLIDTLRSIDEQTFQDFEVILVNDCGEPVEHLLNQFSAPISLIRHGINKGLSAARNSGLKLARGQHVVYLDDDDLMLPEHLETLASAIESHPGHVIYVDADYVNESLEGRRRVEHSRGNPLVHEEFSADRLAVQNFIPVNTFSHPRAIIDQIGGFNESLPALEDWEFLLRLSDVLPFCHIHRTTVEVRTRLNAAGSHMLDRERGRLPELYQAVYAQHPTRDVDIRQARSQLLARFEEARKAATNAPSNADKNGASSKDDRTNEETDRHNYAVWRSRQTLQEIDAQVLAERMVLTWNQQPGIHLLLALYPGEESLLADTLDSLPTQLYTNWLLTVVTDLPAPEGLADAPNVQWLSLRDAAHIDYVVDEMAAASPGTWLARIEPGLVLEPHALQVIADYINARPDWKLIYCDEDTLQEDGSYTDPLFKPDVNLDLLRSQAYFGSLVLVAKESFLSSGRYGTHRGAENYDLSLRVLDQEGEHAVGHISQVLAHLSRQTRRSLSPEAEKSALQDHLARRALTADVLDGAVFGTRRVQYQWPNVPLVSIIIPTRDREEYLRPLIEGIEERTSYPNYEIIVVDNDSSDPDTIEYLNTLQENAQGHPARVLSCPGEFSWAASVNTGASAAAGDYLFFLDNDTHIVQDDWLDRLMAFAQRPEVAIVAPRLTYPETAKVQDAGTILGLYGVAGSPWNNNADIDEPGYMGRALCDQNLSAASGSALLVRRSIFVQLNGIDGRTYPLFHGALDFCLRAGEQGHKIVWTPYTTLVHYNSVSLAARQRKPEGKLVDLQAGQKATDTLFTQWMSRLANDAAYNRNLSLAIPYKPDHITPIDWDTNFHDRPRILATPVPGGAGEYRLRAPLRSISQAGLAHTMISEPPKAFSMRILTPIEIARAAPDILIMHQPLDDMQSEALDAYARYFPKLRRILTLDDLVIDLPRKHPMYKNGYKDGRQRLRRNLSLMDRVVVSTLPLADLCADMIEDIRIMPNTLEWSLWGDVAPPRKPRSKPRVGWAGAQQHHGDLELIYPVVEALADEVDWIFMGMCPDALKPFVREDRGYELDYRKYPQALAAMDLDLAIAPLEIHPFNEAKSNLRLLEYGIMAWPVICTDIFPYQNAPVTRLRNDPELWIRAIREQLAEPEALKQAGLALQQWVKDGFILENHTASWFAAYGS
ncbi:glycosyltransferase [Zoogloea sp.]|uniref:glycosyltransferase n=1 Tax=Zoogloea sp. TaxID=49181 RepID=UPI0035B231C4